MANNSRPCRVVWFVPGVCNHNLGRITTWARLAYPSLTTVEELAPIIEAAALEAPGFDEFASAETKRDLTGWCQRWARCSLSRPWTNNPPTAGGGDPEQNQRLLDESLEKLKRLAIERGEEARSWSQRKVAKAVQLSRNTVRKHWPFWLQLQNESL